MRIKLRHILLGIINLHMNITAIKDESDKTNKKLTNTKLLLWACVQGLLLYAHHKHV